ncbi:MAG: DUF1573 domain-containing protein [Prevotella sp.]
MKKTIASLLVAANPFLGMTAQEGATYTETFRYDKRVHDFGTIEEKAGKVSHRFTFTNTGKEPVAISEVNAWCGCTTATYTKTPIAPGKQGYVTITYNPYNRPGKFSKEAVVMLNGGTAYTRIWIKGDVKGYRHPVTEDHPYSFGEGLYMGFQTLPFACLKPGESYTFHQRIANETDKPMTIEFERVPNNRILTLPTRITLQPHERTTIDISYTAVRTYRYNRYIWVYPIVNGKRAKPMRINWFGSDGKNFTN